MVKMPPHPALAGLVREIVLYREASATPLRQTETASFVVPLLIGFAEPFQIALGRQPTCDDRVHSFASGLCLKPAQITSAGGCSCLEITLTPLGARRLFAMPMHALAERVVPLDDLGDAGLVALRERLGEESHWLQRLAIAEAFLLGRLRETAPPSPTVEWAFGRILARGGDMRMDRLAEGIGWSRKHLAARFREDVGLPPKAVARIARFCHAQSLARKSAAIGWADIAAACGYADQAHLVREFQALAAAAPSAWLGGAAGNISSSQDAR